MLHQLIAHMEPIFPNESVWTIFDEKLEGALKSVELAVSIRLHHDMGHGVELIRWIEGWNLRFRQQQKTLISIAEDPAQQQCFDLSHPDMELIYCSSINALPALLLQLRRNYDALNTAREIPAVNNAAVNPVSDSSTESSSTGTAPLVQPEVPHTASSDRPNGTDNQPELPDGRGPNTEVPSPILTLSDTPLKMREPANVGECPSAGGFTDSDRIVEGTRRMTHNSVIEIAGEYRCDHCGATRMFYKGTIVDRCENRECLSPSTGYSLVYDLF